MGQGLTASRRHEVAKTTGSFQSASGYLRCRYAAVLPLDPLRAEPESSVTSPRLSTKRCLERCPRMITAVSGGALRNCGKRRAGNRLDEGHDIGGWYRWFFSAGAGSLRDADIRCARVGAFGLRLCHRPPLHFPALGGARLRLRNARDAWDGSARTG